MQKLILLFLCMTFSVSTFAQESQSDATWSETIAFINKYKSHFSVHENLGGGEFDDIEVGNKSLRLYGESGGYQFSERLPAAETYKVIINLEKLKKAYFSNSGIWLTTSGKDCTSKYEIPYKDEYLVKTFESQHAVIGIDDAEMGERLAKAFKHLAFLATQKRQEKAKSEKF